MKSLELPTAFNLIRVSGGRTFFQFVKRAFPLFGVKEVENDEYFISNISSKPDSQGLGLGKFLLTGTEQTARERGLIKSP